MYLDKEHQEIMEINLNALMERSKTTNKVLQEYVFDETNDKNGSKISKLRSGKRKFQEDEVDKICKYFNIDKDLFENDVNLLDKPNEPVPKKINDSKKRIIYKEKKFFIETQYSLIVILLIIISLIANIIGINNNQIGTIINYFSIYGIILVIIYYIIMKIAKHNISTIVFSIPYNEESYYQNKIKRNITKYSAFCILDSLLSTVIISLLIFNNTETTLVDCLILVYFILINAYAMITMISPRIKNPSHVDYSLYYIDMIRKYSNVVLVTFCVGIFIAFPTFNIAYIFVSMLSALLIISSEFKNLEIIKYYQNYRWIQQ